MDIWSNRDEKQGQEAVTRSGIMRIGVQTKNVVYDDRPEDGFRRLKTKTRQNSGVYIVLASYLPSWLWLIYSRSFY